MANVNVSAILVVDLGNSSTKVTVMSGKDKDGVYFERSFELSNVFAPIEPSYVVSGDYNDTTSCILKVDTMKVDPSNPQNIIPNERICGNFCNGVLRENERAMSVIRPSALEKKYNLDSTYLSARLVFLYATRAVMNIHHVYNYSDIDIDWKVVTLLPPGDLTEGEKAIETIFKTIGQVEYVFPAVTIPVKVSEVKVLPEGYCAYIATVYDKGRKFRPEFKFLLDEVVMVFDIGAGTTDCLVIKKNALIQTSKYTITQGGNNVYQYVRRALRTKGIDVDDTTLKQGMVTGIIKDGTAPVDISEYINEAKNEIANKLVSEFLDYLEGSDFKIRSIGYALVCGGGTMRETENSKIVPLSEKVITNFQRLSPNSKLVALPTHTVTKENEDGTFYKVLEEISPRQLNVVGASIVAETL